MTNDEHQGKRPSADGKSSDMTEPLFFSGNKSMQYETLFRKASHISTTDLARLLYVDDATRTWNRLAFDACEHKGQLAIVDLDSLKWVNDNMGYRFGDDALVQLATVLKMIFTDDVYRLGGDEFVIEARSRSILLEGLLRAQIKARTCSLKNDAFLYQNSCSFSFGIGSTLIDADNMLRQDKIARESRGWRASRGELPPGVVTK